jgi:hypothetical protein
MAAVFRVHSVTLEPDSETGEAAFTVHISDGRKLTVFSSGGLTLHVPKYGDNDPRFTEAIAVTWPTMDDIASDCNQETGDIPLKGWHRH